jgi:hypothetical protein
LGNHLEKLLKDSFSPKSLFLAYMKDIERHLEWLRAKLIIEPITLSIRQAILPKLEPIHTITCLVLFSSNHINSFFISFMIPQYITSFLGFSL